MTDNELITPITTTNNIIVELQSTSQSPADPKLLDDYTPMDLIGKDITEVKHYNIRNRSFEPTNPYYITKNKTYSRSFGDHHTRQ